MKGKWDGQTLLSMAHEATIKECLAVLQYHVPIEHQLWLERVCQLSPLLVLEIGTCQGMTTWLLSRVLDPSSLIITVDWAPHYCVPELEQACLPVRIIRIIGDAREDATLELVCKALDNRPVDLLFIDADHTYEEVSRELMLYRSLVMEGGHIAFHDINGGGPKRLWNELLNESEREEFHEPNRNGQGFGMFKI